MNTQTATIRTELLLLAGILLLSGGLMAFQLALPGLHNDEAVEAGLQAVQLLNGLPVTAFREARIGPLPLMVQDYIGALNVYLAVPFMAVFGSGAVGLRSMTIALALLCLGLVWWLGRAWFGRSAALIAVLLLAVHPAWIFWYRQGIYIMSLTTVLLLVGLVCFTRWAATGNWRWLFGLGLAVGFGLYAKLLFVWGVGGLLGALAVLNLGPLVNSLRQRQLPQLWPRTPTRMGLFAGVAGTLLGLLPLLIYNLQSSGTLTSVFDNLGTSYYGVNNAAVFENLLIRWQSAREVLLGVQFWYLGGIYGVPIWPPLLFFALFGVGVWAVSQWSRWRWAVLLAGLLVLGFLQSIFTVSGLFHTHLALFLPFPALLVGAVLGRSITRWPMARPIVAAVVAFTVISSLWVDLRYHQQLNTTGGIGVHSDAVYRLVDALEQHANGPTVAVDWGFAPQVRQLTIDRIQPTEVFGYTWESDPEFAARLDPFFKNDQTVYILHWENEEIFPRRTEFFAAAEQAGLTVTQVAIISRRDGAPVFELVRLSTIIDSP